MSDLSSLMNAAFAHADAGRLAEATHALEQVLRLEPRNAVALHELGLLYGRAGRNQQALPLLTDAAEVAPLDPRHHANLGLLLTHLGDSKRAVAAFETARSVSPDPNDPALLRGLGNALLEAGRLGDAAGVFRQILSRHPNAAIETRLGRALQEQGKLDEAIAAYRRALAMDPTDRTAETNLLLALNYHDAFTPRQIFEAHVAVGQRLTAAASNALPSRLPERKPAPDGRLRIGYLSPDFRQHSVAFFLWPILMRHDRARVQVTCYSDVVSPDAVTGELSRLPERWRPVAGMPDDQLARLIADDQIDVLIELAGHTGGNRLAMLARRVAPVQVTYLGYPNTTGLTSIDYRITDALADPPGLTESLHTERLVRLPDAFFCYLTPGGLPDIPPPPALSTGRVTFAVFTNFSKIRPAALELWSRILQAVPGSRLMIQAKGLDDPETRAATSRFFTDRGVPQDRLDLRGWVDFPEFVKIFRDVDILLDTCPFNGHTTSCHALWMGVPMVTLAGRVHRSRMGLSISAHLDLSDLVAYTPDDYARLAGDLAHDLPRLTAVRAALRERMRHSRLLDGPRFARNLEDAYFQMHRAATAG